MIVVIIIIINNISCLEAEILFLSNSEIIFTIKESFYFVFK